MEEDSIVPAFYGGCVHYKLPIDDVPTDPNVPPSSQASQAQQFVEL